MDLVSLPFPQERDAIIRFTRRNHYSRRVPGVWSNAFVALNHRGKICGAALYGPPPYPSISRAFCRRAEDITKLTWQTRLCAQGLSRNELDQLVQFSTEQLLHHGYWWCLTLTDPVQRITENALQRLISRGYSGETYNRNGWLFLGYTSKANIELWIVDGKPIHPRQGRRTLTHSALREKYPTAKIRAVRGTPKARWAYILHHTERERSERLLLIKSHPQPWEAITQPRLLVMPHHLNSLHTA